MRKLTKTLLGVLFFISACNKQDTKLQNEEQQQENSVITQRKCAANEVLEAQLKADPSLRKRMEDIESFTQKAIKNSSSNRLVNGVIEIPVVVNVVYKTTSENISAAQVQSQIDVLNEDFNNTNADRTLVPTEFKTAQTSVGIRFVLDRIIRKKTTKRSWSTDDAVKKSSKGGVDPTNPAYYLNMWSCNIGQGILGYAQFPGGNSVTDGVVILYAAFGSRAKYPGGTYAASFDLGRTATHEIGHWMNLRHIWGDANCGNDFVDDTPSANAANYGCPNYPHKSTCQGTANEMTMDYMDYTDDACMYMFTKGQQARINAVFAPGGPRETMAQ